jgi:hypothetical protein
MLRAARQDRAPAGRPDHPGLEAARQARDAARVQGRWWAWLRAVLAVARAQLQAPVAPGPSARGPGRRRPGGGPVSDREASLAAGVQGERLAADGLGRGLGDDWTLLRGYRNRRGEIDLVLAGPRGLFAIEVKYWNGVIGCDGDRWWVDRYDRRGNHTGQDAMTDARGRSPSTQLLEPARLLEEFLRSRGHDVAVQPVVLLTHPRARFGQCASPAVGLAASVPDLLRLLQAEPPTIPEAEVSRLADRIRRDHEHNQSRHR